MRTKLWIGGSLIFLAFLVLYPVFGMRVDIREKDRKKERASSVEDSVRAIPNSGVRVPLLSMLQRAMRLGDIQAAPDRDAYARKMYEDSRRVYASFVIYQDGARAEVSPELRETIDKVHRLVLEKLSFILDLERSGVNRRLHACWDGISTYLKDINLAVPSLYEHLVAREDYK